MKIIHHPDLSERHLICSLDTFKNGTCCIDGYIASRRKNGEKGISDLLQTKLLRLSQDHIPYGEDTIPSYQALGEPLIRALKYKRHRLFFVEDHTSKGQKMFVFLHCYYKKSQKTPDKEKSRVILIRDAYFEEKTNNHIEAVIIRRGNI